MESEGSAEACRQDLAKQLREKGAVIEEAIVERLRGIAKERREENGGDLEELKKVVQAALEHGFRAIEGKEERQPPPEVATHARALAWQGFRTHTVLRRYSAGADVFKDHLRQVRSSVNPYSGAACTEAERAIDRAFHQLQDLVEAEHVKEDQWLRSSSEGRQLETVRQLLSGELLHPPPDRGYDFSATHIGVVGSGAGVEDEIRRLAKLLGGQLLIVQASPNQFWAWIGLKLQRSVDRLDDVLRAEWGPAIHMGIGGPMTGLPRWRRAHCQAKAAYTLAVLGRSPVVHYEDDPLLASFAGDGLIRSSVHDMYILPLLRAPGGKSLCQILLAYFAADRNKATAATALGMSRQAVAYRLTVVERILNQPLENCGDTLHVALRLERLASCDGRPADHTAEGAPASLTQSIPLPT